jgi:hypothetical protein
MTRKLYGLTPDSSAPIITRLGWRCEVNHAIGAEGLGKVGS